MTKHSSKCTCNQLRKNAVVWKMDPTHTVGIRKQWSADMTRRFKIIRREIYESIVTNDCFGLKAPPDPMKGLAAIPKRQFAFNTSAEKMEGFMSWLQGRVDEDVLEVTYGPNRQIIGNTGWQNVYIDSAYKKGMQRGQDELTKIGITPSTLPTDPTFPIDSLFNRPVHADRVGLLYSRDFAELKGITEAMSQQISRSLAEGFAEGKSPMQLARALQDRVDKIGITRAKTLARTETIRAHHVATINTYKEAGIEGVRIRAEWKTAGFNVCPDCEALEGEVFSLRVIEGMIPLHPNCRCMALPVLPEMRVGEGEGEL